MVVGTCSFSLVQGLDEKLLSLGAKRFVDKGGEPQEIVTLSGRESGRFISAKWSA